MDSTSTNTYRAVVYYGTHDVRVEDRPFPSLESLAPLDVIVRITTAGFPRQRDN